MSAIIQASPLEKLSQEPLPTGDSCVLSGAGTYGVAAWRCDSRLASGHGGRKCSAWHFDVRE